MTEREQKLVKVGPRERNKIALAVSTNKRAQLDWERKMEREKGPAACRYCGAEPCGVLWTRPGDPEPGGERCCNHCTHEPVEGWIHTHTAWAGKQHFPVCALRMKEGEVVYLRRDGTVQFLEMHTPRPGSSIDGEHDDKTASVAFLGRDLSEGLEAGGALYSAGEGGPDHINLWERGARLDPAWLAIRMQAALAKDEARKEELRRKREEEDLMLERRHQELLAEQEAKRQASIEKKALQHEVVTVLREKASLEDAVENAPGDELEVPAAAAPPASPPVEGEPKPRPKRVVKPPVDPRTLSPEQLKLPAPPIPTGGRLKRSKRQRRALERQKRMEAVREAKARLEVKRLQKLAGVQPEAPPAAAPDASGEDKP